MSANKLKLNDSKTEVIVIASGNNIRYAEQISIRIGEEVIKPKSVVCNLGANLDSALSMDSQVKAVTSSSY